MDNFGNLFRRSKFASFNSNKIYKLGSGFKHDMPKKYYGKPLHYVQVKNLDGIFNQCEFVDAQKQVTKLEVLSSLQERYGNQLNPIYKNVNETPLFCSSLGPLMNTLRFLQES